MIESVPQAASWLKEYKTTYISLGV